MKKEIKSTLVVLGITALLSFNCAAAPLTQPSAVFPPLPANWQTMVRGYYSMPGQLKDPYSAMYRFEKPRKGFGQDGILAGGKRHYGWIFLTWINAKNSFGGYTGYELHVVLLSNEAPGGLYTDVTELFGYGRVHFN